MSQSIFVVLVLRADARVVYHREPATEFRGLLKSRSVSVLPSTELSKNGAAQSRPVQSCLAGNLAAGYVWICTVDPTLRKFQNQSASLFISPTQPLLVNPPKFDGSVHQLP